MTDVTFSAHAGFDRDLFWEGGGSVRYLVARLHARRREDRRGLERAPLNIALVIDASGSMGGGKLEAAKAAALGLADRLTERDRLTVVSFASDVEVHLDAVPVTRDNARRIRAEISRLHTRGMTHLSGGWFAGVDCAARVSEEDPGMTPRVILLSDGHANEGITNPDELREHAGELRMRGVLTSALGIGDGYDEQLLRGIAESGGGRLHDAELTSEISSVLLGELDDIFGTVVEDATITLNVPPGVQAEVLGRTRVEASGHRIRVPTGAIQNEVERIAVFKLTCPAARPGDRLDFEIGVAGRAVDDGSIFETAPLCSSLTAAKAGENTDQPRNIEIAERVAQTWSAHVVSTAAAMNRDRAYREAERYLARELGFFKRYVEGLEDARSLVRDLELLARRVGHQFSSRMQKEMVIQSSLAMENRADRRGMGKAAWSARMERGD